MLCIIVLYNIITGSITGACVLLLLSAEFIAAAITTFISILKGHFQVNISQPAPLSFPATYSRITSH